MLCEGIPGQKARTGGTTEPFCDCACVSMCFGPPPWLTSNSEF